MNREQYLQTMGIDIWSERVTPAEQGDSLQDSGPFTETWEQLEARANVCTACNLHQPRKNVVFGSGNPSAELLIIGEAPGAQEDEQGKPFVGNAGQLLTKMLQAIGLSRDEVYIANIVKCRPPDNRDPVPEEVATCTPYLIQQIEMIKPKIILALGRVAAHFLLANDAPMSELRNNIFHYGATRIPVIVTYHPAYLLRAPQEKRKAWEDLKLLQRQLQP